MKEIRHYKDLIVWARSHQLFLDVVKDIDFFPKNAVSRVIIGQIVRSVGSISSNILMRSLVRAHTLSLFVMPEVLNRASSVFLDSPVKPGNDRMWHYL